MEFEDKQELLSCLMTFTIKLNINVKSVYVENKKLTVSIYQIVGILL